MSIQRLVFANERFVCEALPASRESAVVCVQRGELILLFTLGWQGDSRVPGVLAYTAIVSMKRRYRNTPAAPLSQSAVLFLGALNKNTDPRSGFQTMWCDLFAYEQLNADPERFKMDESIFIADDEL